MWKEKSRAEYSYNPPQLGGEGVNVIPEKSAFTKQYILKLSWAFSI